MRTFVATMTDNDGEVQEYHFTASTLWNVTTHIAAEMSLKGDFYGHKLADTVCLEISETVRGPGQGIHVTKLV